MLPSKQGDIYILDRRTGRPLFPVQERRVPQGGVETSQRSPTQPFSSYHTLAFPKLTTPQWIGEPEVEAVVILSIDDLRDPKRYETFLRPILERLKQIDGRAPASILVNAVAPTNAALAPWLQEGVSLEVHTLAHPCPCLSCSTLTLL